MVATLFFTLFLSNMLQNKKIKSPMSRRAFLKILATFIAFLGLGGFSSLVQDSESIYKKQHGGYGGGSYGV